MNSRRIIIAIASLSMIMAGCKNNGEPVNEGKIELSSQLFGVDAYYTYGFNFEESDYVRYSFPFSGNIMPDIINLPFKKPDGSIAAPGFNAPYGKNGFYLLADFQSLAEAIEYYDGYKEINQQADFVENSDTVRLYQVWLQKTQLDNYVKLLVKDISFFNEGLGADYVVVSMDYFYLNDGTSIFP